MATYNLPGGMTVTEDDVGNINWFQSRKCDIEKEVQNIGCVSYRQCSVCYKCINKGSHLYEQCKNCKVSFCHHNEDQRNKLIKPHNFYLAGNELKESISNEYHLYLLNKRVNEECNHKLTEDEISAILKTYDTTIQKVSMVDVDTLKEILGLMDKGE